MEEVKILKEKVQEEVNEEVDQEVNNEEENLEQDEVEVDIDEEKEKLKKEFDELTNRYARLQADFDNFKRRVKKEKESIYSYANQELMTEFVTVIDNFERAFTTVSKEDKEKSFYEGMEMVYKQMMDILKKKGLEEIEALGKEFDPNLHQAVLHEESDEYEEDIVSDVLQKGYKLKDRVVRPSMVKVSK
ncbi:MAG: nucleotide exchange factor GrpE [Firmicutes bacterium]|nr:nucleotide exchange factor GrpE [Bacillota bacterium]